MQTSFSNPPSQEEKKKESRNFTFKEVLSVEYSKSTAVKHMILPSHKNSIKQVTCKT